MSKNITIIGTGYVGLVAAVGLADFGNSVTGCDIDGENSRPEFGRLQSGRYEEHGTDEELKGRNGLFS